MSVSSVGWIWQAFGLKPWLSATFKLSEAPQFVDKVRDVVGLDMNPHEHAVVMYVDEKTSITGDQVLAVDFVPEASTSAVLGSRDAEE